MVPATVLVPAPFSGQGKSAITGLLLTHTQQEPWLLVIWKPRCGVPVSTSIDEGNVSTRGWLWHSRDNFALPGHEDLTVVQLQCPFVAINNAIVFFSHSLSNQRIPPLKIRQELLRGDLTICPGSMDALFPISRLSVYPSQYLDFFFKNLHDMW